MKNSMKVMSALTALMIVGASAVPALAHSPRHYDDYRYNRQAYASRYYSPQKQYAQKALIGGGAGAVLGGLMASRGDTANGAVKGALLGAGLGLGYEFLKQKSFF